MHQYIKFVLFSYNIYSEECFEDCGENFNEVQEIVFALNKFIWCQVSDKQGEQIFCRD